MAIKRGDLFDAANFDGSGGTHVLMHCVGAYLAMGAGIAVQFRRRWGRPGGDRRTFPTVLRQPVELPGGRPGLDRLPQDFVEGEVRRLATTPTTIYEWL